MSRRSKIVEGWYGRDAGKQFFITEKSAYQASKWAWRFTLVVKGTSAQIPPEIAQLGMVAIAAAGVNAFLASDVDAEKLEPLWDELLGCVQIIRDFKHPDVVTKLMVEQDIEEVATIEWLKKEVLDLHAGFPWVGNLLEWFSTIWKVSQAAASNTPTSPPTSGMSSPPEKLPSLN